MEEEKRQGQARQGWDDGNHGWPMWKELRQLDSEHIHILSGIQREWVRSAPEMKIHGNVGRAVITNFQRTQYFDDNVDEELTENR